MTPSERAYHVLFRFRQGPSREYVGGVFHDSFLEQFIAEAIAAAVVEERERIVAILEAEISPGDERDQLLGLVRGAPPPPSSAEGTSGVSG